MNEEEFVALVDVFEAMIDEKISSDHGRDSLFESMRASELKQGFIDVFITK